MLDIFNVKELNYKKNLKTKIQTAPHHKKNQRYKFDFDRTQNPQAGDEFGSIIC